MKRLVLAAMLLGLGCTSGPQGYYEQGIYIPTHVTACVDFCEDRGRVNYMSTDGRTPDVAECGCHDGSTKRISRDPFEG